MSNPGDDDSKGNLKARWAALSEGEVSGPVSANVAPVSKGTGPQLSPEQRAAEARAVAKSKTGEVVAPATPSAEFKRERAGNDAASDALPYALNQASGAWQKGLPVGGAILLGLLAGALSMKIWSFPWFDIGIGMIMAALLIPFRRWHGATFQLYNPLLFGGVIVVHTIKNLFVFVIAVGFSGWSVAEFFDAFLYVEIFGFELEGPLSLIAELLFVAISLIAAGMAAHQMKDDTLDAI